LIFAQHLIAIGVEAFKAVEQAYGPDFSNEKNSRLCTDSFDGSQIDP
jgi:hypothetical protein